MQQPRAGTSKTSARASETIRRLYDRTLAPYVLRYSHNKRVQRAVQLAAAWYPVVARALICAYFIALAWTNVDLWNRYPRHFTTPWQSFAMLPCAVLVLISYRIPKVYLFGLSLCILAFLDAWHIIWQQIVAWWWYNRDLYINELMVKKFSMLGAIVMVVVTNPFFKQTIDTTTKALQGLLAKDEPKHNINRRTSAVLLVVRVLISSLFLFVGYGEIKRQWMMDHNDHGHRHGHIGDGHNQMWLKVLQFAWSVPFIIGFKTTIASFALAACCITEALVYWQFWNSVSGSGYRYHAYDHFTVNMGVAGGLFLLHTFGPGKFSVDAMMKKRD